MRRTYPRLAVVPQLLEGISGDYYHLSDKHTDQFVGRVPHTGSQFADDLRWMDFTECSLAALKSTTGDSVERSWRRIDDDPVMQLHVITYDGARLPKHGDAGYTYVYAHWEQRWDIHPLRHIRGDNFNADIGVRRMKKLLDEYGITYEAIRP